MENHPITEIVSVVSLQAEIARLTAERDTALKWCEAHKKAEYAAHDAARLALSQRDTARAETGRAKEYATSLAVCLHKTHYETDAPDWQPFEDLLGVLTQIDNMTAGLSHVTATAALEQVKRDARNEALLEAAAVEVETGRVPGEKVRVPWSWRQAILALTPADATAALEEQKRLAWNEGVEATLNSKGQMWFGYDMGTGEPDGTYCSENPNDGSQLFISADAIHALLKPKGEA
ncbi:hypothetical protein BVG79_01053 [Ketogulonicigenium robustum]|uniref:Uncharacterized protein n=1 Tax=Ketogulonicigenium robustum TaxID=92947 RepID=A0A1W6NYY2_9RHOB|nr:hypothetical protein [Ketogulonicigenium robustum]ARO14399.1 hypothetical protein BVG79_01053 [Ketogulonicigenium robustum]